MSAAPKPLLAIGTRWHPGQTIQRDAATGLYEEVNPMPSGHADLLQRAYLLKVSPQVLKREHSIQSLKGRNA